jgi:hypothetical protein
MVPMNREQRFEIKAEPQENGLWGIPMALKRLDRIIWGIDQKLFSAILVAIAEAHNHVSFEQYLANDKGFAVKIHGVGWRYIRYEQYRLEGKTLIWTPPESKKDE